MPQGFTAKYGEMLPRDAKLRIACGATWDVRIEKVKGEDCHFFTRGWATFSQNVGLQIFELLVFSYVGNSTFNVSVYATTTLEKEFDLGAVSNPRCQVMLKKYHYLKFVRIDPSTLQLYVNVCLAFWLCKFQHVPLQFGQACGLTGNMEVRFEYPGGESAVVAVNSAKGRVSFGAGWSRFWKANRLTPYTPYSFEYLPQNNLIKVQPHGH